MKKNKKKLLVRKKRRKYLFLKKLSKFFIKIKLFRFFLSKLKLDFDALYTVSNRLPILFYQLFKEWSVKNKLIIFSEKKKIFPVSKKAYIYQLIVKRYFLLFGRKKFKRLMYGIDAKKYKKKLDKEYYRENMIRLRLMYNNIFLMKKSKKFKKMKKIVINNMFIKFNMEYFYERMLKKKKNVK